MRTAWLCALVFLAGCGPDMVGDRDGAVGPDGAADDGGSVDGSTLPDAGPTDCLPLACDATPPDPGRTARWNHPIATRAVIIQGDARHRGRDLLLRTGEPQWALAKFAYGPADDDLKDEAVDMWLLRDCTTWEFLGSATTTNDGDHATVEGVEDTGGWVFFEIPASAALGVGRHRIHFVVRGDHEVADQFIQVIDRDVPLVVSDVDGTLTESETAEFLTVLNGPSPTAQPSSAELLWAFAEKGYTIFYVTARPHWLHTRTHEWLDERFYPPGLVHTTLSFSGALDADAEAFKTAEIADISARIGHPPDFAFGNTDSDAAAYANASIDPANRYLYQFDGDALGGQHFDDYATLLPLASGLAPLCP